ncbi:phosphate ABC transporter permease [Gammaproteobacteria bacterium 45_16_T64]|nr:phosphate ABC transporter permease [Gammaproteobacteria bacterium 45_16_T64]
MENTFESRFGVSEASMSRLRKIRKAKDRAATVGITIGGLSVVFSICLIFFYLLYEVIPLLMPASIVKEHSLQENVSTDSLFSVMEEQAEIGLSIHRDGQVRFYSTHDGNPLYIERIFGKDITAVSADSPGKRVLSLANSTGEVIIVQHDYHSRYADNGIRTIVPSVHYPYGEEPIELVPGESIKSLAFRDGDTNVVIAAVSEKNRIFLKRFEKITSFLSDSVELEESPIIELPIPSERVDNVLISSDQRWLFLVEASKQVEIFDLRNSVEAMRVGVVPLVQQAANITVSTFLLGGISLLLGDDQGNISQWFMVKNGEGHSSLEKVREFSLGESPITQIVSEHRRKGFVAGDSDGNIGLFNTTAEHVSLTQRVSHTGISQIVMSPRGDNIVIQSDDNKADFWKVNNEHPEVSFMSLWREVWYENYNAPGYVWQSSSASNDFEPKFSVVPLTFGTLKAAFYAMLLATPLAIGGAIFTAYFMAPSLRQKVKPTIELMEAMPTVILGFLAGLWLAPLIESNLPGIVSILVLTPIFILLTAYGWSRLPQDVRLRIPSGWEPVILIPVVVGSGALSMGISGSIEELLFGGDMRQWLTNDLGVDFDQRNSMVVGLAMGFAVIPTIFSITEDAIFAVPKNLTFGSLALGASPWQTLVRVILPTASPGIFSALMIGLGRAVGETMIVLMATGNTPIMDMNIFEGLRTLSANISVEMPEAEVDSSHFRILFLSGLVLFIFTFIVNTIGETVRQRLREKYGSL